MKTYNYGYKNVNEGASIYRLKGDLKKGKRFGPNLMN